MLSWTGCPGLSRPALNCVANHNSGCVIEAELVPVAKVIFDLGQEISFGIGGGLPRASLDSQVKAAERQASTIGFLVVVGVLVSGLSIHGLLLPC